jgi:nitroreductase
LPSSASWARAATGLAAALLTCGSAATIVSGVPGTTGPQPAGAAPAVPAEHVDPQTATAAEVVADLTRLDAAVDAARTAAANADAVLVHARADLDAADARAARQRRGAEALEQAQARQVDPPTTDVFEMLGRRATSDAEESQADTSDDRADATAAAVAEARAAVDEATEASADTERDQEAAEAELAELVTAAQARSETRRAEADQVAWIDPAYADRLRADEDMIAGPRLIAIAHQQARAAEDAAAGSGTDGSAAAAAPVEPAPAPAPAAAPAPPPTPAPLPDPTGSASGALEGAWCADGRRVVVDASIGLSVQFLINDAAAAGIGVCARSGFRSYAEQVELRRQNCGTSDHAVFVAPPSTCSPPTARPGSSNHEDGLAVDFDCADGQPMTHASPCYQWLAANAINYGLHNLPSEPWHWSVTGR